MPEILELAARELGDTAAWYEEQRPGYGSLFLEEAESAFDFIDGTHSLARRGFSTSSPKVHGTSCSAPSRFSSSTSLSPCRRGRWIDRLDEIE